MNLSSSSVGNADPSWKAFRQAPAGRLRPWRWVLLAALLLGFLVLAPGAGAQSDDPVLVSNTGQDAGTALATSDTQGAFAQSFTTGSQPDGYDLKSVELGLAAASGGRR